MEDRSPAVPLPPTESRRPKRSNTPLIIGIVIVSLASFGLLGLLVNSLLTLDSRPIQSADERDVLVAEAQAQAKPKDLAANVDAARTNILTQDYETALLYADRAVKIDPTSAQAKLLKAQALQGVGDLRQARTVVQEVQKMVPEATAVYANASAVMAGINEAEGKLEAAVADLQVAKGGDPTNADLLVDLARMQERVGKKDEAAATYGEALQYVPDLEPALDALQAMKSGPADYELAKIAWQAGDQNEARRLMEQAAKESPQIAWVQVALGEFRVMVGDKDGARSAFEAALSIDPANEEAKAGLDSL